MSCFVCGIWCFGGFALGYSPAPKREAAETPNTKHGTRNVTFVTSPTPPTSILLHHDNLTLQLAFYAHYAGSTRSMGYFRILQNTRRTDPDAGRHIRTPGHFRCRLLRCIGLCNAETCQSTGVGGAERGIRRSKISKTLVYQKPLPIIPQVDTRHLNTPNSR